MGLNGYGARLTLDRLLPDDNDYTKYFATIYSLNDKQKCNIGHFVHGEWNSFLLEGTEDYQIMKEMNIDLKKGSFFKIPISDRNNEDIKKEGDDIRLSCLKFLSILISKNEIDFYWNKEKQNICRICPLDGAITLKYTIGHFVKNEEAETNRARLYINIDNYNELDNTFFINNLETPIKNSRSYYKI